MPNIADEFSLYDSRHKNPINQRYHWVGIPLIVISLLVMLNWVSVNFFILVFWGLVLQFQGNVLEKKKPVFFESVMQLLIGTVSIVKEMKQRFIQKAIGVLSSGI